MLEYLKDSCRLLILLRSIDFTKQKLFKILPSHINRNYVLAPFIKRHNYLTGTNEQLVRKLDKFLEDFKDRMGDKNKN